MNVRVYHSIRNDASVINTKKQWTSMVEVLPYVRQLREFSEWYN